jgi:hypothetical protein
VRRSSWRSARVRAAACCCHAHAPTTLAKGCGMRRRAESSWRRSKVCAVVQCRSAEHDAREFLVGSSVRRVARVGLLRVRSSASARRALGRAWMAARRLLRARAEVRQKIDEGQDEHERKGVESCARERVPHGVERRGERAQRGQHLRHTRGLFSTNSILLQSFATELLLRVLAGRSRGVRRRSRGRSRGGQRRRRRRRRVRVGSAGVGGRLVERRQAAAGSAVREVRTSLDWCFPTMCAARGLSHCETRQ